MLGGCSARLRRQRVHYGAGAYAKFDADRGAHADARFAYRIATNSDARTVAYASSGAYADGRSAYRIAANSNART